MITNAIHSVYAKRATCRHFTVTGLLLLALSLPVSILVGADAFGAENPQYKRIVAIGGAVTEIIFALGEEHRLVARDTTSVYPEQAFSLPDVGYIRRLSPEGVLSVNPDLILAMEGSGPPETMATLQEADVPIVIIPEGYTGDKIREKILAIGKAINTEDKAGKLAEATAAELSDISDRVNDTDTRKKVLFILSLRNGKLLASGKDTAADGIITLAGGSNVITRFSGYKQVSDEAVISAQPDVILMMNPRGNHSVSDEEILSHPAIVITPAGKSGKIVRMDGLYMLGFGPRTASAATDLFEILKNGN